MRAAWFVAALAAAAGSIGVVAAGCILVTGGTDGYTAVDSGTPDVFAQCITAANCKGDGANNVCCLVIGTTVGTACLPTCAPLPAAVQLCETNAECQGQELCISQACSAGMLSFQLNACGLQLGLNCVAIEDGGSPDSSSPSDSGAAPDSGVQDSGGMDAGAPDATTTDASDAGIADASLDSAG